MLRDALIDDNDAVAAPVLAQPTVITDAMIDEANQEMADVLRNELAFTAEELDALAADEVRHARPDARDETRVTVSGRRFVAEARVAGGRWQRAGSFAVEAEAWRAARVKLDAMRRRTTVAHVA